ncbi:hypothetical protein CgunFtcFv8_023465 [Champsocephalus gunnari]|uniref:Uncharacterized protein n=2 Tax=Channichthyidae TaxID=30806 RepID=A0AAN8DCG2_CHAGU|nr:hypothetical protein KUCAC02_018984 [Chaenocephalus aceratus]KAK5919589.1 hypothetical protein CgunFtcFv8_023465 [Champsocephalus gunnari]
MEAPSSSQTCKVLDCAVAPVVHIIMENGSKAPKAIRMAPEGAPTPQGLALYVITEEIIVSLPALTHRQRGMIKILGITARCGMLDLLVPDPESNSKPKAGLLTLASLPQLADGHSPSTADGLVPLLVEMVKQKYVFCVTVDICDMQWHA